MADFNPNTGLGAVFSTFGAYPGIFTQTSGTANTALQIRTDRVTPYLWRVFLPFDTSSLPDDATVTAAELRLYRDDALDAFVNADSSSAHIVPSSQASNTALVGEDYDQITRTSEGSITFASTTNGAYSAITITDLSMISLTGHTKLAVITSHDLNQVQPATGQNVLTWQNNGGANPPILRVTYTTPDGETETAYFI